MGLFGFIKKAVTGLGKIGFSLATGGPTAALGTALKVVKGRGLPKTPDDTMQQEALLNKIGPPVAKVARTETNTAEGWGFGRPGNGPTKRKASGGKQYTGADAYALLESAKARTERETGELLANVERQRGRTARVKEAEFEAERSARLRRIEGQTAAAAAKRKKRAPPTGGLDLKALSASWRAAGKPGSWIEWIKANK